MNLSRVTIAATAVFSLVAASVAFGCDNHKASTASKSGCGTAKATNVSSKSGCQGKASMSKADCAKACAAKGAVATTVASTEACTLKPGRVSLRGTIACNHCDFKKTDTCQTILTTAEGCAYVVTGEQVAAIREAAGHQTKIVKVRGDVDSTGTVSITTYKVVGDATPNVGI